MEYAAVLLNKYHANGSTGRTAYATVHGREATEKLAHVGERVYFLVPKRRRSNLDLRWAVGVYLGTLMTSNEAIDALPDGGLHPKQGHSQVGPKPNVEEGSNPRH